LRIAITGHRGLPTATERLVDQAIRDQLATDTADDHLVGLSNLADGADQIFARAVLDAGGQLEVIVPAAQYRDGLPEPAYAGYDSLLSAASKVDRLSYVESTEESRTWRQAEPCWHEPTASMRSGMASPPADTAAPPT
jgi:hypothetical protein